MFLWEQHNKAVHIADFKDSVNRHLKQESDENIGSIFVPILKDFFKKLNMELVCTAHDLFDRTLPTNLTNNMLVDQLSRKIATLNNVFLEVDGKENMHFIQEYTSKKLFFLFANMGLDNKEIAEIIKSAIRKNLNLSPKDAVFFSNKRFLIKYFNGNDANKRANGGANANEFERIYNEFSHAYYEEIIDEKLQDILVSDLNLKRINNVSFHQAYMKVIQKVLAESLIKDFTNNISLLPGFVNYIFRIFFDHIIEKIVDYIIVLAEEENANIKNFIGFYDGKETYIENNMIEKTAIKIDDVDWSYGGISTLLKERRKALDIYKKESVEFDRNTFFIERIQELREKLIRSKQDLDSLTNPPTQEEHYKLIVFDIDVLEKEIAARNERNSSLQSELAPFKEAFDEHDQKLNEIKIALAKAIKDFRI